MNKRSVELLMHRRSGREWLVRFREDPEWKGVLRQVGPVIEVAPTDMERRPLKTLREALKFEGIAPASKEQELDRRLERSCKVVSIMVDERFVLELTPLKREGSGFVGRPEDRRSLAPDASEEQAARLLAECLTSAD